jgi:Beta-1,3-glucanase
MAPTLDIELQNWTNSNHVFVYITGQALDRGNHVCFIEADGKTLYLPESPSQICSPVPIDCAIKLGAPGTSVTVTIPQLAGGRIWFSIDKELTFLLNPGPAIVEPSISNPSDPNINILWDFCEFTFANNLIYANISYVDFVSLSIALTLIPQDGATQKVLGLKPDGFAHVCAGLEDQRLIDASDWHKLIFKSDGKKLRCLSPNNAIVMNGGNLFKGYYDPYVNEVW